LQNDRERNKESKKRRENRKQTGNLKLICKKVVQNPLFLCGKTIFLQIQFHTDELMITIHETGNGVYKKEKKKSALELLQ